MVLDSFEINEIKNKLDDLNDFCNVLELDNINNNYHNIFYACCYDDKYLPIIKILDKQFKIDYLSKFTYDKNNFLERACLSLSKETIKWIFNKMIEIPSCIEKFTNKNDNDLTYCFASLTENLDLEMMKFLYYKSIENNFYINIKIDNDEAFRYSCLNDEIDIAEWIYSEVGFDLDSITTREIEVVENNILGIKNVESNTICIEAYDSEAYEAAEWLVRLGYKPENYKDHEMYNYWRKYKLQYMIGIFVLIKFQRIWKNKIYHPDYKIFMIKAKEHFEKFI